MKVLLFVVALVALARAEVEQRIVNGETATYGDHPYICSLQRRSFITFNHICGAVIYSANKVVTAAHCVDGATPSSLRVVCGLHSLTSQDAHQQTISLQKIQMHPQWSSNGAGFPNDIAVMFLSSALSFNSHVSPAEFASTSSGDFSGQTCTLSGWGRLSGGGSSPTLLQKVDMPAISNNDCSNRWAGVSGASINDGHICFMEENKSACNGDSGGPVRCGNILAGVTSWGIATCDGSRPSVYTRISYFNSWIASTV